ncbi:MAG TPA: hypothetical protein VJ888_01910 [Mobilitalea sp.]|nr:hypothetical protein [Mobilitalea sp.]
MGELEQRGIFDCAPEIDFDSGYRYFLGNMNNYVQAILSTLKSIKSKVPLLRNMYRTKEFEGLRTITRTLQIMMSNIGVVSFGELSFQIESALLNREDDLVLELLDEYISKLYIFSGHLDILFQKLDSSVFARNNEEEISFRNYDFTKTKESIKLSADYLERKII